MMSFHARIIVGLVGSILIATAHAAVPTRSPRVLERYVAVDNVCAWPNLTVLRDGTIIATIFNSPSHGRVEGEVEC